MDNKKILFYLVLFIVLFGNSYCYYVNNRSMSITTNAILLLYLYFNVNFNYVKPKRTNTTKTS